MVYVVGPAGVHLQSTFVDASYAAGVRRFIIDDFGWGPNPRAFEEFAPIHAMRTEGWDHAKKKAEAGGEERGFTWTGISVGNPIDWVCLSWDCYIEIEAYPVTPSLLRIALLTE